MSGVISSMESELKESQRFQFFQFPLQIHRLWSSENSLSEMEAEAEDPTNHKVQKQAL